VAWNGDENSGRKVGGLAKVSFARRGQKLQLRLRGAESRRGDDGEQHCANEERSNGEAFETRQLRPP
jgi:hypothetical protein